MEQEFQNLVVHNERIPAKKGPRRPSRKPPRNSQNMHPGMRRARTKSYLLGNENKARNFKFARKLFNRLSSSKKNCNDLMKNIESKLGLQRGRDGQLQIAKEAPGEAAGASTSGKCSIDVQMKEGGCRAGAEGESEERKAGEGEEEDIGKREFNRCKKIDLAKLKAKEGIEEEREKKTETGAGAGEEDQKEAYLSNFLDEIECEAKREMWVFRRARSQLMEGPPKAKSS